MIGTGNDFDEGGFACAVFTKERVDFTCLQINRNPFKGPHGVKRLSDVGELDEDAREHDLAEG